MKTLRIIFFLLTLSGATLGQDITPRAVILVGNSADQEAMYQEWGLRRCLDFLVSKGAFKPADDLVAYYGYDIADPEDAKVLKKLGVTPSPHFPKLLITTLRVDQNGFWPGKLLWGITAIGAPDDAVLLLCRKSGLKIAGSDQEAAAQIRRDFYNDKERLETGLPIDLAIMTEVGRDQNIPTGDNNTPNPVFQQVPYKDDERILCLVFDGSNARDREIARHAETHLAKWLSNAPSWLVKQPLMLDVSSKIGKKKLAIMSIRGFRLEKEVILLTAAARNGNPAHLLEMRVLEADSPSSLSKNLDEYLNRRRFATALLIIDDYNQPSRLKDSYYEWLRACRGIGSGWCTLTTKENPNIVKPLKKMGLESLLNQTPLVLVIEGTEGGFIRVLYKAQVNYSEVTKPVIESIVQRCKDLRKTRWSEDV